MSIEELEFWKVLGVSNSWVTGECYIWSTLNAEDHLIFKLKDRNSQNVCTSLTRYVSDV